MCHCPQEVSSTLVIIIYSNIILILEIPPNIARAWVCICTAIVRLSVWLLMLQYHQCDDIFQYHQCDDIFQYHCLIAAASVDDMMKNNVGEISCILYSRLLGQQLLPTNYTDVIGAKYHPCSVSTGDDTLQGPVSKV